jgi:hypothetical protein
MVLARHVNMLVMCVGFGKVGLKNTRVACKKKELGQKKFSNGHNEWKKACLDLGF